MKIDLAGRTALVTGAGRGIGREIALALAGAGANVACVDISEPLLAETVAKVGPNSIAIKCDVRSAAEVDQAVGKCVERFGGLDILVNNAGITRDGLLIRMKEEDWDAVLDINLKGPFLFTKAAARHLMKSKAGRVINISSVAGVMGNAGQANYSSSKAGIIGLTKTSAREFASRNVCINAIAPGFINTEMAAKVDPKYLEAMIQNIPLKRMGEAREIASAVLFLASDLASYVTGQVLQVDGGMRL
jgi:3-oxoacyl-[acyl-carrier protein] reductase